MTNPWGKTRVLFLCIGNSCRSPMAEAFANAYGPDVLEAQSAGLSPAAVIQDLTRSVMREKNIEIGENPPRDFSEVEPGSFDMIVNMSGQNLGVSSLPLENWPVRDPIGLSEDVYRGVAADIEQRVMMLVLGLRRARKQASQTRTGVR